MKTILEISNDWGQETNGDTLTVEASANGISLYIDNGCTSHEIGLKADKVAALHKVLGEWLESEES